MFNFFKKNRLEEKIEEKKLEKIPTHVAIICHELKGITKGCKL